MQEREQGTDKARDLIRMGVAKAALLQPQEPIQSEMDPKALVIGAGISGMTSALTLANRGYQVFLVEKSAEMGGLLRNLYKLAPANVDAQELLAKQVEAVSNHENINLLTSTTINEIQGYIGHYEVTVSTNGVEQEFGVGVIIIATGAKVLRPEGLFNYDGKRVITQF